MIETLYALSDPSSPSWLVKKTDWHVFSRSKAWDDLPTVETINREELTIDLYNRLTTSCQEAVPQFTPTKYYPKTWWNDDLNVSKQLKD